MIPRYRAWDKIHKTMYEVDDIMSIDFGKSEICVKTLFFEQTNRYDFDDIVLMQSTGLRDKFRVSLGMFVSELVEYNNFERLCNVASSRKIIGNIWEHLELVEVSS